MSTLSTILQPVTMINVFRPHFDHPKTSTGASDTVESLTRDVHLKPIHSHNDYWRKRPLLDALLYGCVSVEGDIWHFKEDYTVGDTITATTLKFLSDEMYVGHNQIYLKPENTLDKVYFDPMFSFLESANKEFSVPILENFNAKFGLFYDAPEIPLYFWLDLKTEGTDIYAHLKKYLSRFIDKDYLAFYDHETGTMLPGPVIITLTGNVPWDVLNNETETTNRYVYADCPLHEFLGAGDDKMKKFKKTCVFASASLEQLLGKESYQTAVRGDFSDEQQAKLKQIFDVAHENGIKTRIWGGVDWPIHVRDSHWTTLWRLGCDLINADDLAAAANIF